MLENSKIIIDIDSCTKCKACVKECNYYYFDSDTLNLKDEMDKEKSTKLNKEDGNDRQDNTR